MPSGAAQLPAQSLRRQVSSPRSRYRLPSAADAATRARFAPPSRRPPPSWPSRMSGHRPRRPSLCPHPLSAMRTDVRPTGRADVRCPRDRCPRDRCDAGVRTDRRPVSAAAAAALSAPRWFPERVGAAGTATLGAAGCDVSPWSVSGLVVAARIGPGGEGMVVRRQCVAGTSGDGRPGPTLRTRRGWGAALVAWATKDAGPAPGAGRVAGGTGRSRRARVAPPMRPGQVAGVMADHGAGAEGGDHASWSLS
jgi:hypothetical protein